MAEVAQEQGAAVADLAEKLDNAAVFYREREKWTKEREGFTSAQAPMFASVATLFEVCASQERRLRATEAAPAITCRLALAALRLAALSLAARDLSPRIFRRVGFRAIAEWCGHDDSTHAVAVAIDDAVAALREAGEVSE